VIEIPPGFAATVRRVWGQDGVDWLTRLPRLVEEVTTRWQLTLGPPYDLSFHWVAAVSRDDGTPAVLRLGVPGQAEDASAAHALGRFDGDGAVRLLAYDPAGSAMLLERAEPGAPLAALAGADDRAATGVLLAVMRRLHRPAEPHPALFTVAGWGRGFDRLRNRYAGGTGPLPAAAVARAERLWAELAGTTSTLLHGDLHHDNVLRSGRDGWLAIDPKGVLGEPLHDTGPLLLNPWDQLLGWPDPAGVLAARIDQLAEGLRLPARTVRDWGFAFAIMSAIWTEEDGGGRDEHSLTVADILS
jgi:streptomycin 6-kinase